MTKWCRIHSYVLSQKLAMTYVFLCLAIQIQSFKKEQITMDMDFWWCGNQNIILAVEKLVASLPIQVCRLLHNLAKSNMIFNFSHLVKKSAELFNVTAHKIFYHMDNIHNSSLSGPGKRMDHPNLCC